MSGRTGTVIALRIWSASPLILQRIADAQRITAQPPAHPRAVAPIRLFVLHSLASSPGPTQSPCRVDGRVIPCHTFSMETLPRWLTAAGTRRFRAPFPLWNSKSSPLTSNVVYGILVDRTLTTLASQRCGGAERQALASLPRPSSIVRRSS